MSHGNQALPRVPETTWPPKNGEVPEPDCSGTWPQPSHSQQKDDGEGHKAWQSTRGHTEREDSVCRLVSSNTVD